MSPLSAPDAMLKLMPPTKLMVAEIDALRDNSFVMAMRLLKLDRLCQVILMKDFIHGFNNMDINVCGVEEFSRGTSLTIEHFNDIFNVIKMQKEAEETARNREIEGAHRLDHKE